MRVVVLTVLLLTSFSLTNTKKVKKLDWKFSLEIFHSYLCTGNLNWWKDVDQSPLMKLAIRGAIFSTCYDPSLKLYSKDFLIDAKIIFQQTSVMKRMEASQCLWSGIKDLYFVSFLCPGSSEEFTRKVDKSWDYAYDHECRKRKLENIILCRLMNWALTYRNLLRKLLGSFCKNSRQKRQYDVSSLMAIINQAACWNAAGNNIHQAMIVDGGLTLSAGWSIYCCFSRLIIDT